MARAVTVTRDDAEEEKEKAMAELKARAADMSKGAGLRQLRQIMVRIMKGETAMRLEIWRTCVKMDAYAEYAELQAALEAQLHAQEAAQAEAAEQATCAGGHAEDGSEAKTDMLDVEFMSVKQIKEEIAGHELPKDGSGGGCCCTRVDVEAICYAL